jgi:O-antigen/teichoic acid export membrane protein
VSTFLKITAFTRNIGTASSGSMAVAQAFFVKILMLAMNLGTGILSARVLGPTGRAEQAAILVGVGIFPAVLSFGLPIAVQFKLRTAPESAERWVSIATILAIAFGLVCAVAGYILLPRIITQYSPTVLQVAQLFMLGAPFVVLTNVFNGVLQARNRFAEANISQYGPLILTLVVLVTLVLMHQLTPITSATAYLVTNVMATCWLATVVKPKLSTAGFREATRGLMSFGLRSYVTDILGTLQVQVDTVLVINLLSPSSMGLYAIALSAARLSDLFSGAIVTVLFPKAASLPRQQMLELTNRVGRLTFAVILPTIVLNIVTMPYLLPAFFGKAFSGAVPVAQVLALTFILNGTGYVISQAFLSAGKPGVIAIIQAAGLVFVVPLMLVLIPRFGLIGAAWALVLATFLRGAITLLCFPIVLKAPIPSLLLTAADIRFVKESLAKRLSTADA